MTLASVHPTSAVPSPLLSPEAREDLNRYAEAGGFTLRAETHPWYAAFASVSRLDEARAASTVLAELRGHNLPDLQQAAECLAEVPGLATPTTVRETATAVALLLRVRSTLEVVRPEAYAAEAATLEALLAATATSAWRAERGVSQSWWQRTRLARRARALTASRGTHRHDLHSALAETAATRAEWTALTGSQAHPSLPRDVAFLDAAGPAAEAALTGLGQLTLLLRTESEAPLEDLSFADLAPLLDHLASDEGTLYRLPRLRELHDALVAQGLGDLLAQLTEQQADVTATAAVVAQRTALDPKMEAALTASPAAEAAAEPEASPVSDDEAQAQTEAVPDADADEAPTAATATATAAQAEPVGESEAAVAPITEAEPVAETLAEPVAEIAVELSADTESAPEALPAPSAETESAADVESSTDAEAKTDAEPETEAELDADPEAEAEAVAESVAVTENDVTENAVEAAAETAAEAEPVPDTDAEFAAADESETEPSPSAELEPVAQPEPAPDDEPVAEVETPTAPVMETEADTEADCEAETAPEAEAAPKVEPEAAPQPVAEAAEPEVAEALASGRAARPDVPAGKPVTAYTAEQLEVLVRWIDADGVDRTDDELLRAAMKDLGFSRLGPRIKEALGAAVTAARA